MGPGLQRHEHTHLFERQWCLPGWCGLHPPLLVGALAQPPSARHGPCKRGSLLAATCRSPVASPARLCKLRTSSSLCTYSSACGAAPPPLRSDFSLVDGHCFKSLLVGKTNTLNYYQAVNGSSEIQVGRYWVPGRWGFGVVIQPEQQVAGFCCLSHISDVTKTAAYFTSPACMLLSSSMGRARCWPQRCHGCLQGRHNADTQLLCICGPARGAGAHPGARAGHGGVQGLCQHCTARVCGAGAGQEPRRHAVPGVLLAGACCVVPCGMAVYCWLGNAVLCPLWAWPAASQSSGGLCGGRLVWAHSCGTGVLQLLPEGGAHCGSTLPTCPPAPRSPAHLPTCTLPTCTHPAHLPAAPTHRATPTRRWSGCARASAPRTSTW